MLNYFKIFKNNNSAKLKPIKNYLNYFLIIKTKNFKIN